MNNLIKKYKDFFKPKKSTSISKDSIYEGNFVVNDSMIKDNMLIKEMMPDIVKGNFDCSFCGLTSLENCPKEITGKFIAHSNNLTNLKGLNKVLSSIHLANNHLTSLEYLPKEVYGYLIINSNKLKDLKHCPVKIVGDFNCNFNLLTSLENYPLYVYGKINVYNEENIEELFVKSDNFDHTNRTGINYFKSLFEYIKKHGDINDLQTIYFSNEFKNSLNDKDKNLFSNVKKSNKFNL